MSSSQGPVNISEIPLSERLQVGPFFFGVIWNWFLLGILFAQLYIYYLRKRRDSRWMQALIAFCMALDLTETALTTHGAFQIFVNFYGQSQIVIFLPKTFLLLPLFDAVIASVVQCFYGWRIWILSKGSPRRFLAPLIFFLAFMQSIACLVSTILLEKADNQTQLVRLNAGFVSWLSSNVAVDVIIALTMIVILGTAKSETYFTKTQDLLSRLLRQTITTGVATATCTILVLALFLHKTGNNEFDTPTYILGKLYSNSLLANLNARPDIINDLINDTNHSHELSVVSRYKSKPGNTTRKNHVVANSIQVQTTHEVVDDHPGFVSKLEVRKESSEGEDTNVFGTTNKFRDNLSTNSREYRDFA